MKTLTPTNLIAVEVPKDAIRYEIKNNVANSESIYIKAFINDHVYKFIPIDKKGVFKILGEVTDTEISFDVESIVKLIKWTNNGEVYLSEEPSEKTNENWYKEESFRSLLHSNGLYFENPIEKPILEDYKSSPLCESGICTSYQDSLKKWQSYESKLIKGKLIILKPI